MKRLALRLALLAALGGLAFAEDKESLPEGAVARLGSDLWHVGDRVQGVAVSPDGERVVVGSSRALTLFGADGKRLKVWKPEDELFTCTALAFAPDGKSFFFGSSRPAIGRLEIETGTIKLLEHPGSSATKHLRVSPDGKTLAVLDTAGALRFFDIAKGTIDSTVEQCPYDGFAWRPDGKAVGVSGQGVARVLTRAGELVFEVAELQRPNAIAFSPDGEKTAVATGEVILWLDKKGKELGCTEILEHGDFHQLTFTPDGKTLVCSGAFKTSFLDPATQKVRPGPDHGMPQDVALTPDGARLLVAQGVPAVLIIDVAKGATVPVPYAHPYGIDAVAFAADGKRVFASSYGHTVVAWSLDGKKLAEKSLAADGRNGYVHSLAASPDGKTLAAALGEEIVLAKPDTLEVVHRLKAHDSDMGAIVFSADGKLLASVGWDGRLSLWEIGKRRLVATLETLQHKQQLRSVAFSPDGKLLAAASTTGPSKFAVKTWDLTAKPPKLLATIDRTGPISGLAFVDGESLAISSSPAAIYAAKTGKELRKIPEIYVGTMVLTPSGLVATSRERIIIIDPKTAATKRAFEGHLGEAEHLAASPDGKLVVSGGEDGLLFVWKVD